MTPAPPDACPFCGERNPPGAQFCVTCGRSLAVRTGMADRLRRGLPLWATLGGAGLVVLGTMYAAPCLGVLLGILYALFLGVLAASWFDGGPIASERPVESALRWIAWIGIAGVVTVSVIVAFVTLCNALAPGPFHG